MEEKEPIICPNCGGNHVEVYGAGPGDYPYFFCPDCGLSWDDRGA